MERMLMERTAEGDSAAFRGLFEAYYPQVYGFMRSILGSEEDAADLAQEVFLKLWLMRVALPDISSLGSYLYRMSLNQAVNYIKKNKPVYDSLAADLPYDQMVEEQIDLRGKEALIAAAVGKMPQQRRRVFILSRLEHFSNEEIASLLGIRKKTVENHLNLALRELRAALPVLSFLSFLFFD